MNEHYRQYREAGASMVLRALKDAVIAQERERCAKLAAILINERCFVTPNVAEEIAAVIRQGE